MIGQKDVPGSKKAGYVLCLSAYKNGVRKFEKVYFFKAPHPTAYTHIIGWKFEKIRGFPEFFSYTLFSLKKYTFSNSPNPLRWKRFGLWPEYGSFDGECTGGKEPIWRKSS